MGLLWITSNNHSFMREEMLAPRGKKLFYRVCLLKALIPYYILYRKVNVDCQKKFSDSEEYAGRRRG